jgi:hypothetical protein
MDGKPTALVLVRGCLGAIVGAAVGYLLFRWLLKHGLYGIVLPGAFLGLGTALAARSQSLPLGIAAAMAAVIVTIVSEWLAMPFAKDTSFTFFLTHLHALSPAKLLMMTCGVALAFWLGQGR